jgi:cytochrome P450
MTTADPATALSYPIPSQQPLEPPADWARLRQGCPVAPITLPSGDPAVLVTRYADVRSVLSDPRFSRRLDAAGAARVSDTESGGVFNSEMGGALEGAAHDRWRRMVVRHFTAKRMAALRPTIEAMAERLVDRMVGQGPPADLASTVGFPLPVWVICELLGVPEDGRDDFAYWSNTLLDMGRYPEEEIAAAQIAFGEYMAGHVAAKRADPGEDLLSVLITGTDADGVGLTDFELIVTGQALLVAGHETTSGMIGKMVAMLLADRRRWEQLLADPTLVRSAVEEVLCSMAAANRDESVFDGPAEMMLGRVPNVHLAFGAGPHSCLGQPLARTELTTVLEVLLRRLPSLRLAVDPGELRREEGLIVGRLMEVPVRW